ncbi:MAG: PhzF family phenazine biosynthesis protein [Tabrizicola sp.]|nr:PhzF family phenazine biosynthesis protein [Tabrizicola sp.]
MLAFHTCDVFTDRRYAGNPLGIVLGADDLTAVQMQTIAREFNLSETIFVQRPVNPAHTARVRIFLPFAEIPFAGHPTIGCAIHLATGAAGPGDFDCDITLEEEAGLVPVRVWRRGAAIRAEFKAPVLPHGVADAVLAGTDQLAAATGLLPEEIGFGDHRPGIWQGGPRFLFIPVGSLKALARSKPMEPAWAEVTAKAGAAKVLLYTRGQDCDFRTRMYGPGEGVLEDPATGSASAILAAQLMAARALSEGESRLTLHQGVEMGRPSEIGLTVRVTSGSVSEVRIQGSAVPVSEGRIHLPT